MEETRNCFSHGHVMHFSRNNFGYGHRTDDRRQTTDVCQKSSCQGGNTYLSNHKIYNRGKKAKIASNLCLWFYGSGKMCNILDRIFYLFIVIRGWPTMEQIL